MSEKNEIRGLRKSFFYAWRGVKYALNSERNFQVEVLVAIFVIALIFIFQLKVWESIILILMIMWVLITELTNTVVERVVDILKPRAHPYVRMIKDMMAAVVLISSFVAVVVGVLVFYPYFAEIF